MIKVWQLLLLIIILYAGWITYRLAFLRWFIIQDLCMYFGMDHMKTRDEEGPFYVSYIWIFKPKSHNVGQIMGIYLCTHYLSEHDGRQVTRTDVIDPTSVINPFWRWKKSMILFSFWMDADGNEYPLHDN